jgi:predicted outer membrane repeat protein
MLTVKETTMKRIYLLLLGLVIFSFYAKAQNFIVGATNDTIDVTTTWDYDTVFVDTTLTILDDVVLTIESGTAIIFNGFHGFEVEGTLISEGTETDSIYYTVADTTGFYNNFGHLGWDGIEFDNSDSTMNDNEASTFAYCKFSYANKSGSGGVISSEYYDDLVITHSDFEYNYCSNYGGAIYLHYVADALISDCKFLYNTSNYRGGAIDLYDCTGSPVIFNCIFDGNHASYAGGAIKAGGYSSTQIINNVFINNKCDDNGGAIMSSGYSNNMIYGNLFMGNYSGEHGGAIKVAYYASAKIINNTIINNEALYGGGGIQCGDDTGVLTMKNNIIRNNIDSTSNEGNIFIRFGDGRSVDITNNNIGGGFEGICVYYDDFLGDYENNIDEDPMFVDEMNGDYTLMCGSPCINTGINTDNMPEFDINGNHRLSGANVDMGMLETISAPIFIAQPENSIACENSLVIYSITADFATAYQWQVSTDFGGLWTNIDDDEVYSGTTTATVDVISDIYLNGNMYRCMVTGPCESIPTQSAYLIVNPLPYVDLGLDQTITTTESIQLDADVFEGYLWNTDETTQTITVDGEELGVGVYAYSVVVTDQNLCTGEDAIEITVVDLSGIDEADIALTSIYPNPSDGVFNISAPLGSTVQIIDVTGKIIRTINFESDNITGIDLTDFDAGIYYAKFLGNKINKTEKIIVK